MGTLQHGPDRGSSDMERDGRHSSDSGKDTDRSTKGQSIATRKWCDRTKDNSGERQSTAGGGRQGILGRSEATERQSDTE